MTFARRIWNFFDLAALNASAEHPREVDGNRRIAFLPPALRSFTKGKDKNPSDLSLAALIRFK